MRGSPTCCTAPRRACRITAISGTSVGATAMSVRGKCWRTGRSSRKMSSANGSASSWLTIAIRARCSRNTPVAPLESP